MRKKTAHGSTVLRPRLRVEHAGEVALGPGKVELLGYLAETGNLSEAARRMKLSYMKAWLLVQVMNKSYRRPLVTAGRGGRGGGGATLTPTGRRVLGLYRAMEASALAAVEADWREMRKLLRGGGRVPPA